MSEELIIAPVLLVYELTTIMRKAITAGWLSETAAAERLSEILQTGPLLIPPDDDLNREALFWAKRIGQNKAYDSHYLALAARESATLWTADRRLANGVQQAGLAQVHWIGDWSPDENQ
jgi:predicted nucleic acid-binding protein